jgi:hypothetical protein
LLTSTLLLLGIFSFELWFESYLDITEESLHFWKIADQSLRLSSAPLLCSALSSLCPTPRRRFAGHVLSFNCPALSLCAPRAAPAPRRRSPDYTGLSSPCRAALPSARTAFRRCSPSLQPDRRHLLLLAVPTRHSPVDRRSSSPRCLLPHAPRCPSLCPSSARDRHARRRPPAPAIAHCALSSTRSTSRSSQYTSSYVPAPTFPRPILFPTTAPHRASSVAFARRQQPPTQPPIPDRVHN